MADHADPDRTIDPDRAQERLDELGEEIEEARDQAGSTAEPGREGRTFADLGVREQVERHGDTHHPKGEP